MVNSRHFVDTVLNTVRVHRPQAAQKSLRRGQRAEQLSKGFLDLYAHVVCLNTKDLDERTISKGRQTA